MTSFSQDDNIVRNTIYLLYFVARDRGVQDKTIDYSDRLSNIQFEILDVLHTRSGGYHIYILI